ncbi:MAG: tyrosine-type recombinase/integrase [Sulfuriferula sp.]
MSLYKRPGSTRWWCKFVVNGRLIRQSTGTADPLKAAEYEAKLHASIYDQTRLGIKPMYSWNDAVTRYVSEHTDKTLSTRQNEIRGLQWLHKYLSGVSLQAIDRDLLDKIIKAKQQEGVKPRTVNAVINLIRVILRKAMLDWKWIDRLPKFRILQEPKRRVRFITREEWARLQAEMPPHLRRMATFAIETGVRRANVTGLRWSQVDLERRIVWYHADQMKARKAHPCPLTNGAVLILREAAEAQSAEKEKYKNADLDHVFTFRGKTVRQTGSTAWENACMRAGIQNFRFHDLRHTWASWHIQDGTPLHVLQELGGWETPEMVQKYAHLSVDHLAGYVQKRDALRPVDNTILGTGTKNAGS